MKLQIGENIKNLRREKNLTQEEFAEIIGVSAQAVSRWENDTCYPDMELLPTIAGFFNISVDKLIGADNIYEQKKIMEYKENFKKAISKGLVYECIDISRKAVEEFPSNFEMLNQLMYSLFLSTDDDGNIPEWKENAEKYDNEIIEIGERIRKYCPDERIRLEAIERLAFNHCEMGRKDIGRAIYETLPTRTFCKEGCIWWALEENEKLPYLKNEVYHHYEMLTNGLWRMLDCEDVSLDTKSRISETLEALLHLFEDNTPTDWSQARIFCDISKSYFKAGSSNKGFQCLRIASEYARIFDNRPEAFEYDHFIFGKISKGRNDFETTDSRCLTQIMCDKWMNSEDFDCVRKTKEFGEIIKNII